MFIITTEKEIFRNTFFKDLKRFNNVKLHVNGGSPFGPGGVLLLHSGFHPEYKNMHFGER